MKTKNIIAILAALILIFGAMPLTAQNSPAGGLASGNVMNRDVDTYMMVNYAPFLSYDRFFTFFQTTVSGASLSNLGLLNGLQAGFATKALGGFMNFYLNTSGYELNNNVTNTDMGAGALENSVSSGRLNLQFDTIYGEADLGTFKLGLIFSDAGKSETYNESLTGKTRTTVSNGFFTPSLAYGKNFIYEHFNMLLLSGTVNFRFPFNYGRTVIENTTGGITTTTTTAPTLFTPSVPYNASNRLEVMPQMWYFFKPQLEPMVVISHIYLINTFVMMFYPEETMTIERAGLANGYTRQEHNYVANTLFGYYNRLYVINSRFSLAWRVNLSIGFYLDKKGDIRTKALGAGVETVTKQSEEELYVAITAAPRLAFSFQAIPGTLALNGAVVMNSLGNLNSTGWQFYRKTMVNKATDVTTTQYRNIFTGINAFFTMGAAWNLSPHLLLEGGVEINTAGASSPLSNISLGVVYKR